MDASMLSTVTRATADALTRAVGRTPTPALTRELFSILGDAGLAGLTLPEEFGGIPCSAPDYALIMEEMAAIDLGPAIFLSVHTMISNCIVRHGSPTQRARYLPRLASGELLGAFALTEPRFGSDAAHLVTTCRATPSGWELTGEKCYITSAGAAELYVTFARDVATQKVSAFIIDCSQGTPPGFVVASPDKKMGCELSPIASITYQQLALPADALLGTAGEGLRVAFSGLTSGRVNIAACANGLSRTAIERSRTYLNEREQFGEKLSSFQGLQFMFADMVTTLAAARLLVADAAEAVARDPASSESRTKASMAKCFATDGAMRITTDSVQLFGGAGYLSDYGVEKLMRDAKMLQIVEGTNQIQRLVIARQTLSREK